MNRWNLAALCGSALLSLSCATEPRSVGEVATFHRVDYVWVPAGSFMLGSRLAPDEIQSVYGFDFTEDAKDGWSDQLPLTKTAIDSGFWMAAHEVTVAEFRAFVDATGFRTDAERDGWGYGYGENGFGEIEDIRWRNPGWEIAEDHPVVLVSLNDTRAYIEWYDAEHEGSFRLPTEAEWEYAARAGTETNFFWGNDKSLASRYANVLDSYFEVEDGHGRTAPVGSFEPNPWGLHDIVGNVWEWTSSRHTKGYDRAPQDGDGYVDRGGGWDSPPYNARIANRGVADDGFRAANLGFRLVREGD